MNRSLLLSGVLALSAVASVSAQSQQSLGAAALFQHFTFEDGLGVKSANLFIAPVAYELPLGRSFSIDLYSAFARGAVEIGDSVHTMTGFVDTRVRANWNMTPWALLTVGVNLPTGNSNHTSQEAQVANVLSTEVLGFREASWGLGFGATTGLATAYRIGGLGVGFGASYRVASEFEPLADTALKYTPGNETRLRLALDSELGSSKLTAGITFQNYARDELNGQDLFQPGQRWRGDVTYSFRTGGAATWTLFAADVWRQHGDVRLADTDTTFSTGKQNMLIAGLAGAIRLSESLSMRPTADIRMLTREEEGGEGWIAGIGTDLPLRWGAFDVFPSARFLFGKLQGGTDETFGATGGEIGLSLRWGGG